MYAPGDYPRRQYQLDVVADVVARLAAGSSAARAASPAGASATSARRWAAWVASLCAPNVLMAHVAQLDPQATLAGVAAIIGRVVRREIAVVLDALERLGTVLVHRGVDLGASSGLGRVLEWQHHNHGIVIALTTEPRCLSPPMVGRVLAAGR